ncbi:MAG: hypothetical protein VB130_10525 [Clostridium sp.]|nr:hypothetical protein [Clostridium sp.]
MPICPCLKTCPFYNDRLNTPHTPSKELKIKYCMDDNFSCARLLVARFLGVNSVPLNLLPNEMYKAEEIINNQEKY